ncbi:venom metalloproteinase antarease TserMP_A-like [Dermacentor andersoni]|uniref:venom metalloproteinase antarease TserMP_A-like n=1 Tax=Dermacentor andersoni TaxID=34620 RepID=UPI003B3ACD4E
MHNNDDDDNNENNDDDDNNENNDDDNNENNDDDNNENNDDDNNNENNNDTNNNDTNNNDTNNNDINNKYSNDNSKDNDIDNSNDSNNNHIDNTPSYRAVVYPKLFEGRDENTKVLKINDEITLNLQPSSILHEEFFLRKYRQGVSEYRYFDVETLQQDLYHDSRQLAAVIVSEEDGVLRVEGVVGPKLKIRPVEATERSEYGPHAHLIDTIEDSDSDNVYGKLEEKMMITERAANDRYGFDPSAYNTEIIYPEVLITCDSVFHHGFKSTHKMLKYVMVTFQVVVIRYLGVKNPRVRPILRGIELTNYTIEHHYYSYLAGGGIDALKSLYSIKDYVATKTTLYEGFDLLYFITGHDMIALQGGKRESALSGFAFVGSACLASRQQLGEDTAYSYRGIRIMTHEIAHTLGCSHDGTAVEGHLRGFKADSSRCPWSDGYIMSYIEEDVRSMKFSTCCDYDISQYSWIRASRNAGYIASFQEGSSEEPITTGPCT